MEEIKMDLAKGVYADICAVLDRRGWHYKKEEEKLHVHFGVSGEDIPMQFIIFVDAQRQLVRTFSPLPFKFCEDKRMDGAIAACVASFGLADGSFDYDITTGDVVFRMTATYRESKLGEGLFQYLINYTAAVVDKFNDKFFAINKGLLSIADFIADC